MSAGSSDRAPITHVAIRYKGKVWSLPPPNRHHNVIRLIADETGDTHIDAHGENQGFVDADGRYLTRARALVSALCNKQVLDENDIRGGQLYSEDLW